MGGTFENVTLPTHTKGAIGRRYMLSMFRYEPQAASAFTPFAEASGCYQAGAAVGGWYLAGGEKAGHYQAGADY
tara:strand:- start:494 stop:715 length:222 start_codon:yes stop_codon:yes gene_type:complete